MRGASLSPGWLSSFPGTALAGSLRALGQAPACRRPLFLSPPRLLHELITGPHRATCARAQLPKAQPMGICFPGLFKMKGAEDQGISP